METKNYMVKVSSASHSASCKGRYVRVAVLEWTGDKEPSIIKDTKTCNVVKTWENCSVGRTEKCASARAIAAAKELCKQLQDKQAKALAKEQKKVDKQLEARPCEIPGVESTR